MKSVLGVILLGLVGGFLGYMAGMYLACYLVWPESNLCGLVGVFLTGPSAWSQESSLAFTPRDVPSTDRSPPVRSSVAWAELNSRVGEGAVDNLVGPAKVGFHEP